MFICRNVFNVYVFKCVMCKCVKDLFDFFINYNVYVVYFSVFGNCGIS